MTAEKVWTRKVGDFRDGRPGYASASMTKIDEQDQPHYIMPCKDVPIDEELAWAWFAYTGLNLEPPPECIRFARFVLDGLKLREET